MTKTDLRLSIRYSYINAALWSLGNGLTSSSLVIYLAFQLMTKQITDQWWVISFLIAAPSLVGILRWFAPTLIGQLAPRKSFCVSCFAISGCLLLLLPLISAPGLLPNLQASMIAMVVLWCVYHLFEYLAVIALWSWIADLVPPKIRGRFIGRRERWLLIGRIVGMIAAGYFVGSWKLYYKSEPQKLWIGYAIPAVVGAVMMIVAVIPLARMKAIPANRQSSLAESFTKIFAPLTDQRFRRLLYFGCCFSLFNGISQSAQNFYHWQVLHISLMVIFYYRIYMRLGQTVLSSWIGKMVDRFGNRPVMILSQFMVALGPLFYYLATPQSPWILIGAWTVWIAYIGLNVALPNIILKLSPKQNSTSYISTYFAITGVFFGLSTILGGYLYQLLQTDRWLEIIKSIPLVDDHFDVLFLFGCATRMIAILLLLRIIEPGAFRWRQLWRK